MVRIFCGLRLTAGTSREQPADIGRSGEAHLPCEVAARIEVLRKKNILISRIWVAWPFPLHEAGASVGGKMPYGSRERAPVHVQCEPKGNDKAAHKELPSNFAISLEAR